MALYEKLLQLVQDNPELTFRNDGYEELPREVKERNKGAIAEIEAILKVCVWGFSSFQNFKPRPNGSLAVRCQVWHNEGRSFKGVSYFDIAELKDW